MAGVAQTPPLPDSELTAHCLLLGRRQGNAVAGDPFVILPGAVRFLRTVRVGIADGADGIPFRNVLQGILRTSPEQRDLRHIHMPVGKGTNGYDHYIPVRHFEDMIFYHAMSLYNGYLYEFMLDVPTSSGSADYQLVMECLKYFRTFE